MHSMSIEDSSTWPLFANQDPEFDDKFKAHGGIVPMFHPPDIATARQIGIQIVQQIITATPPDFTGIIKSTVQIPMRDGVHISSVLYQPEVPSPSNPLVLLYHGGMFCMGKPELEEPIALELVRNHGAVVLSVEYRMAPEHVFPGPLLDSFDALAWAAANSGSIKADPSKGFIVGGTSAGSTISAAVSLMWRDAKNESSPPLTGVWLNVPFTIGESVVPEKYCKEHTSHQQNSSAPLLDMKAMQFMYKHFKPNQSDPRYSPLLWPTGHEGLPPHLIQCAGMDLLRDDALVYTRELKEQNVPVRSIVYPGVPHGFDFLLPELGMTKKFLKDRAEWFAERLGKVVYQVHSAVLDRKSSLLVDQHITTGRSRGNSRDAF